MKLAGGGGGSTDKFDSGVKRKRAEVISGASSLLVDSGVSKD